jgi:anaerobic selenocysteine-containing dehydrogenase
METQTTFCRICEALCGLEVDVDGGAVVDVRPDAEHVATRGFGCLKGLKQHKMYDSPDRLLYPERRGPGGFERVSWDGALTGIGAEVRRIRRDHGPNAIAMYVGTAAGFSVLHPVFAQGFMNGVGSKSMYSSATQDCSNKFAVSRLMYGFPFTLPFPDVRRTRCLIVVGANPVVSKWSFLQVPNPTQHLREITERGGQVWIVDPRKTETAKATGQHVFIRPNTDVFFYLSFLREVLDRGGVDPSRVARHMVGLDALRDLVRDYPAERTEEITRIPADTLREMVASYLAADGAALYSSTGVNMSADGSLCYWLQEVINAITGNLDRAGGTLVGKGMFDFPKLGKRSGTLLRDDRSRVGGIPSVNDAFAGGLLADEILTEGPGQVRALFVTGGNPLITMPNAGKLKRAFEKLELLVTLDIYKNETGSLAHYVLPATSPFERADLPFIFPFALGLQSKPYVQATRALVAPRGEQRDEASIYLDLCRASGVSLFGSRVAQKALETLRASWLPGGLQRGRVSGGLPLEVLLDGMLRASGGGSFDELLRHAHGKLRKDHAPAAFLGERVLTDDGKVQLAPPALLDKARSLPRRFEEEQRDRRRLKLISKRAITTHNSWTHNIPEFVDKNRSTNHVYMHPEDATTLGLAEGALADVTTAAATIRLPVRLLPDLMPGTVAVPHGWGHQHAVGLSVASKTTGVNVNLLALDGPENLDRISGMAHLSGFNVEIVAARGPLDPTSWSGLPPAASAKDAAGS